MTTASSPLFVVLPPEVKSLSPEATPPTPYTPNSTTTAFSVHHSEEGSSTSPTSPDIPDNRPEMNPAEEAPAHEERERMGSGEAESSAAGGKPPRAEMTVAPPNVLPPSPPLTEIEEHERASGERRASTSSLGALDRRKREKGKMQQSSHMPEEDITNWRTSVYDAERGSYHEDDLGWETTNEATPVDNAPPGIAGSSARPGGASQDRLSVPSTSDREPVHPLRLDIHPPSPPPWEVIPPPETNNSHLSREDAVFSAGTSRGTMPKSA
ncbi:hypothetical protein K474DRAFT_1084824 [Panus rudis PR-1116 ss-1]|nr:hypothetical protein K474DRAFT_1084824 [Panus rudis PR-1116 ss-1]